MSALSCSSCGSNDTEVYEAESDDEGAVLHCYECGAEELTNS